MGKTLRPVEKRTKGRTAGVGFLELGQRGPPHQLGGLGSAVSSPSVVWGGAPEKFVFWDLRNHVRMVS